MRRPRHINRDWETRLNECHGTKAERRDAAERRRHQKIQYDSALHFAVVHLNDMIQFGAFKPGFSLERLKQRRKVAASHVRSWLDNLPDARKKAIPDFILEALAIAEQAPDYRPTAGRPTTEERDAWIAGIVADVAMLFALRPTTSAGHISACRQGSTRHTLQA